MKRLQILGMIFAVMLTAKLGRITYNDHVETWYNLPMQKVVQKAVNNGYPNDYWERADGMKMISHYIICAGAPGRYGEIVKTSRGEGIILDTHRTDASVIDLATTW